MSVSRHQTGLLKEVMEPVIVLPDYTAGEVRGALLTFFSETRTNVNGIFDDISWQEDDCYAFKEETVIKSEVPDESLDIEPCKKCKTASFQNMVERELHVKSCQLLFKCNFCKDTFKTEAEKQSHEESYKVGDGQLRCRFETCDNHLFKDRRRLVRHIKQVHQKDKDLSYNCFFCNETFKGITSYKNHLNMYKDGPKNYKCPEENCGSRFKGKITLQAHLRRHRGEFEYGCETCGKIFPTKWSKQAHMRTHVSDKYLSCMCHICSKIFKNKDRLNVHLKLAHADAKDQNKYKCDQCEKGFQTMCRLKRHMVMHTGIRDFTCATCGNKFLTKPTLQRHEITHTGEKPFKCSVRGKGFLTPNKVKRHEVVHTGAMDFNCSICGKQFNQKINRNTHEKKCQGISENKRLSS